MRLGLPLTALATASALVLVGCGGDPAPAPTSGTPAPSGDVTASATAEPRPTEPAPESTAEPAETDDAAQAEADFYCEAADDGYLAMTDLLEATDRKSAETGAGDGGDVDVMNEAAEDILAAMEQVVDAWTTAQDRIDEEPWDDSQSTVSNDEAAEAFTLYFAYLDAFARPEAQIAAEAATIEQYSTEAMVVLSEPGVAETATEGAGAIGTILEYTLARCGDLPGA